MMEQRLPWPEYFMRIARLVAERSTCLRRKVGAIAVKDKRILATGYNGAPSGLTHCLDMGYPDNLAVSMLEEAGVHYDRI